MVLDLDLDPTWDPVPVPNPILVPASVPNLVPVLYLVLQSANMHCIMFNKILKHASQMSPLFQIYSGGREVVWVPNGLLFYFPIEL